MDDNQMQDERRLPTATSLKTAWREARCLLLLHAEGPSALHRAAKRGNISDTVLLLQHDYSMHDTNWNGETPLSIAAQHGHSNVVLEFIKHGAAFDAGPAVEPRSAVSSESELEHPDETHKFIETRPFAGAKTKVRVSRQSHDSPLLLAGHVPTFEVLVEAGAQVNVRSAVDGETPLISAARWHFFAGAQLLLARGGSLCNEAHFENEGSLIPSTLETMRTWCDDSTFEFQPLFIDVFERLHGITSQLQHRDPVQVQVGALVSLASIIFCYCRFLLDIESRESPILRFVGSRAITSRVQDLHEALDHYEEMLQLPQNERSWLSHWHEYQLALRARFEKLLLTDKALLKGRRGNKKKMKTALLLQYELKLHGGELNSVEQEEFKQISERFHAVSRIKAPIVPDWFISRDDVAFQRWNIVRSETHTKYYKGEWRKMRVMIETSELWLNQFIKAAKKWFQVSHPNVVKLFGACHVGSPRFFVYEWVPEGRPLNEFLMDEPNRAATWKYLYDAALGLQHLHSHGIVHGSLRSESVVIGSDSVVKLCGERKYPIVWGSHKRSGYHWMAPELARLNSLISRVSDIYAFGMCVWEALVHDLLWGDLHSTYAYLTASLTNGILAEGVWPLLQYILKRWGRLPAHPSTVSGAEWDFITKMCMADPISRVEIAYVVNRLKQFVSDSEQVGESVPGQFAFSPVDQVWT